MPNTSMTREKEDPVRERFGRLRRWRARVRAHRLLGPAYRGAVGVIGTAIILLGLILVPAPGPGWLIVFAGLAVLATEFPRARRLLDFGRRTLAAWTRWLTRQPWWVRAAVGIGCLAIVAAVALASLALLGTPSWITD
jgi:uncharacterized protein (TIGR02611 family)